MEKFHSEDITFCSSQCDRTACFRHPGNIRDKDREHTFSPMKGTAYCEIVQRQDLQQPRRRRRQRAKR